MLLHLTTERKNVCSFFCDHCVAILNLPHRCYRWKLQLYDWMWFLVVDSNNNQIDHPSGVKNAQQGKTLGEDYYLNDLSSESWDMK